MKTKLLIPFIFSFLYSFGRDKTPPIDTLMFGEYENYCGLACNQFLVLKKDFTYEYTQFGSSNVSEGTYKITRKKIKLKPADGRKRDITEPSTLIIRRINKSLLLITKRERYLKK